MGKIKASLADVSTEFQLVDPGNYDFEITKYEDVEKDGEWIGSRITSKVITPGEMEGRSLSDYIHITKPGEDIDPETNIGLKSIKRYFEVTHGKEEVATWSDDDFDTDLLVGKTWQGQIAIGSYTPKNQPNAEPRKVNEIKRMEPVD